MTPVERFRRGAHTAARGRSAETDGIRWLELQGFRAVARNVRTNAGEIDLVALEGDTLCFVEIKARASEVYGEASTVVSAAKKKRLAGAAGLYLARHPHGGPCRFDLLAMDLIQAGWRYTLIRNAFEVPLA